MGVLELAVDVVARGEVLGVDHTSGPERVARILGETSAENRARRSMWRDHGRVDFFWERARGESVWRGTHFTVQLHRLAWGGPELAAAPLRAEYGPLRAPLRFEALRSALADVGVDLVELPGGDPGSCEYWQPESAVQVLVADDGRGEVSALVSPLRAGSVAGRLADELVWEQRIGHLLGAGEARRRAWIARRRPEGVGAVNWWLHLFLRIEAGFGSRAGARGEAVRLYLWAVRHAQETGAFSAAETVIRISSLRCALRSEASAADVADVADALPTAAQIVRSCLAAVPLTLAEARTPFRLRSADLDVLRRARRAKNLINAAAPHLRDLEDPSLAAELTRWMSAVPNLP